MARMLEVVRTIVLLIVRLRIIIPGLSAQRQQDTNIVGTFQRYRAEFTIPPRNVEIFLFELARRLKLL